MADDAVDEAGNAGQRLVLTLDHKTGTTQIFHLPFPWPAFSVALYWFSLSDTETGAFNVHLEYANASVGDSVVPANQGSAQITVEAGQANRLQRDVLLPELPWEGVLGSMQVIVDKAGARPYSGQQDDLVCVALELTPTS